MPEEATLEATTEVAEAPPSTEQAAPPAQESGPTLDLQDFDSLTKPDEAPPKEDAKPATSKEAKTTPEKPKEEKPADDEKETIEIPQKDGTTKQIVTSGKDYSDLTEEEARFGKSMNRAAFDFYKARLLDNHKLIANNKELREQVKQAADGGMPQSYYEHPQAYVLSKEYPQLVQNYRDLEFEQRHWKQQLINIRGGKDWEDLNYDAKTGRPTSAGMQKPSPEAEINVMEWMNNAGNQLHRVTDKISGLQDTFKKQHETVVTKIKDFTKAQNLDFLDDEKSPGNKIVKEAMAYLAKDGLDNNVLAPIISKVWALAVLQQQAIAQLKEAGNKTAKNAADARRAQPTASNFSGGTAKADRVLSLEEFGD